MSLIRRAKDMLIGLPIFAQGLAGLFKVNLQFNANAHTGSTDGKTVFIPTYALPVDEADMEGMQRLADHIYGLVVHEIGHVLYTDFGPARPAGAGRSIYQAIEDPRQEVLTIQRYPGARPMLGALCRRVIEEGGHGIFPDMPPASLVSQTCNAWLRNELRQQSEYADIAQAGIQKIKADLGDGVAQRLQAILVRHGLKLRSTADSIAMAKTIIKMLKEEQAKAQADAQAAQAQAQQPTSDAGNAPGQPCASDPPQPDPGQSGAGAGAGPAPAPDGSPQQASNAASDAPADANASQDPPNGNSGPGSPDIADAIAQALAGEGGLNDLGDIARATIQTIKQETEARGPTMTLDVPAAGAEDCSDGRLCLGGQPIDVTAVAMESSKLRLRLTAELQAKSAERSRLSHRGQNVSMRHVHRLATGDGRVFLRRQERKQLDTAVMLLVDVSGSMNGERITTASNALFAAASALEPIRGVSVAAHAFPGRGKILGFGQRASLNRDRFALAAHGGTPLVEGLVLASRELVARREDRKLLVVLTDGEPAQRLQSIALIQHLRRRGIEIYGIGIQSAAVAGLFPEHGVIQQLGDLSTTLVTLLRAKLGLSLAA